MRISTPSTTPSARRWRLARRGRVLLALLISSLASVALAATASAATYYVTPAGNDTADGTTSAPFQTISKAAATARAGDTVLVGSGTYPESVPVTYSATGGVTFRGVGPTPPVLDGGGTRKWGFINNVATGLTIENFEITGQTDAGIYTTGNGADINNNYIHDVGSPSVVHSNAIRIVQGSGAKVRNNIVSSIGPGSESMGIWLLQTRDATVQANSVSLVRKEGIRDWQGLDNLIRDNRTFLNWAGISLNTSTGSTVVNNYTYDNVLGVSIKHTSYRSVLDYWKLSSAEWTHVWHNTAWRNSAAGIDIGSSNEPYDYVDVEDNILASGGRAEVHDIPSLAGDNVLFDGNAYATGADAARYLYKAGWDSKPGISDWGSYTSSTGWEAHGRQLDPALVNPGRGNLDYPAASPAAAGGVALDDPLGAQLGARGLPAPPQTWTPYPMKAIASSSPNSWYTKVHLQDTVDNDQQSYWLSDSSSNEFVTYDLGTARTFDHAVLTVFGHFDKRNIRGYRFEISDDGTHWTKALEGTNADSAGAAYAYAFPRPTTARYVRFTMLDTFCDSYSPDSGCGEYFVFSDLKLGSIEGAGASGLAPFSATPPPPSKPTPPPSKPTPPPSKPTPPTPPPPTAPSTSTSTPPAATAFDFSLAVPRQSLASVLRKGAVRSSAACSSRCTIDATVSLDRRTKRSLELRGDLNRAGGGSPQIAAGSKRVDVKLKRSVVRRLRQSRKLKRVSLVIDATATSADGSNVSSGRRRVRLR